MNVRDLNLIYVLILFLSNKAFFDLVKGVTSNFFQVLVFKDSSQIHFIYHILLKNRKYFILISQKVQSVKKELRNSNDVIVMTMERKLEQIFNRIVLFYEFSEQKV